MMNQLGHFRIGPGGPGDTCACPCGHRPMCYLCRRDRHQLNLPRAYSAPVRPKRVA